MPGHSQSLFFLSTGALQLQDSRHTAHTPRAKKAGHASWPYGPCCCSRCLRGGRPWLYEAQDDPSIFYCTLPPLFRLMAIVAITAPAHVRSHTIHSSASASPTSSRDSQFSEGPPFSGRSTTHTTPQHTFPSSPSRCWLLKRGIIDAIGIETDKGSNAACIRGLEEDWVGFGGV